MWTDEFAPAGDVLADLAALGYDTRFPPSSVITAFQRHFLPDGMVGEADAATARRAAALRRIAEESTSFL
jgi:N-acetylmuramoyl-L-alanine amidase